MRFVSKFKNDDHFKKWFATYECVVPGCEGIEKTVEIDPKNFSPLTRLRCPKCGKFGVDDKRQELLDNKKYFEEEIRKINLELEILEMTSQKKSEELVASGATNE